ncbi:MAG: phosphate butyryltransferase [Lachnospiraceae bacterium]|nr:phosphate butyryltransferase [Lachnospiraceae bacterium]MBR2995600.1 phosphate butyryltransferase [Lachnospiraceae bacterium]
MSATFDDILKLVGQCSPKKLAVAAAQDEPVLEAVAEARKRGIAEPILVGDEKKIREISRGLGIDLSGVRIIDEPDVEQASLKAVKLVHDKEADMYMKGILDTKTFLRSVLNKEVGLRTGKPLSHVAVFEIEGMNRLLFLTDVAFIPYPTLEDKETIINYTVQVAKACGVVMPKVAPLAAVEVVNPKMPACVEADQLTKWNEEGRIKDCIVDGPLSMDLAIDPSAAQHKAGASSRKIVGDADILLFPDIHSGNMVYKTIVRLANFRNGCLLTGTKAPVILTSRSDSFETKINSIALAAVVSEHMNSQENEEEG